MSTPIPKRRRLNHPQTGIHKPFRSPLRVPRNNIDGSAASTPSTSTARQSLLSLPSSVATDQTPQKEPARASFATQSDSNPSASGTEAVSGYEPSRTLRNNCFADPVKATTKSHIVSRSRPFTKTATTLLAGSKAAAPPSTTTEYAALQSYATRLSHQIAQLQPDIDTLQQALRLLNPVHSGREAELEALVVKWRDASRAAADEVFTNARERVNRMGGVVAWKERERDSRDRQREWDREAVEESMGRDENGNKMTEEDIARLRAEYDVENDQEEDKAEQSEDEQTAEDESFTMGMMLKTLNIDPKVIGYDKELNRWTSTG